jgi:hypothetical protein
MTSVLRSEDEDSASYYTIPLTPDIIKDATRWLHGIDWAKRFPKNETEVEDSIEKLLKKYLNLLQKKNPKENSFCDLMNFILDHKWSLDSWGSKTKAYNRIFGSRLHEQTNNNEPVEDAGKTCREHTEGYNELLESNTNNLLPEFDVEDVSRPEDVYFLWRFIHKNLAR